MALSIEGTRYPLWHPNPETENAPGANVGLHWTRLKASHSDMPGVAQMSLQQFVDALTVAVRQMKA